MFFAGADMAAGPSESIPGEREAGLPFSDFSVTSPVLPATTVHPKQYWPLTQRGGQAGVPKAAAATSWFPEE